MSSPDRSAPRVRFSPAPSGALHVGSARTALFNWAFARNRAGTFLLRIEDTDSSRSRTEWIDGIQDTLSWLRLGWDEPPVHQSSRRARYLEAAEKLLASGHAYECFETPEELEAINAERKARGLPPGYDGRARELTVEDRARLAAEGRPRTVRFRTPDDGVSVFLDAIRGEVSVDWTTISDFVIVRADGSPLFFLANAVDDLDMGITHVIRGEDLLDSTHRVLALRRALGADSSPVYAHLPLILRPDRAKLSKRHGAVSVEEFRDRGILPEALLNYLALLGWAPEDGREVMTRDEIASEFRLDQVTHSAAVFDERKLEWLNGEWIRRLDVGDLAARVLGAARDRFGMGVDLDTVRAACAIGQERATTLVSLVDQMAFLFVADDDLTIDDETWDRVVATERIGELLDAVIDRVASCPWDAESLDLRPLLDPLGLKARKALPAIYAAVEGRDRGLPLFDSMHLLGRDRALARLRRARFRLGGLT